MMRLKILLMLSRHIFCAPGGDGGPGSDPSPAVPPSPAPPTPAAVHSDPAPPPAATIVLNGQRTEREVQLEQELEATRTRAQSTAEEKKEREKRINQLEDEIHRLITPNKPKSAPWRFTLFDED